MPYFTGFPTKNESISLHSGFHVDQNWLISVLNHLVSHENTQLRAKTKKQALNRNICIVLGRLYSLFLYTRLNLFSYILLSH